MKRSVGRLLPWLPCVIAAVSFLLVLWNIVHISVGETLEGATSPFPIATTTPLMPGKDSWTSTQSPGNTDTYPDTYPSINPPANLNVEITSFDAASQTISARLSLVFSDLVVSRLRVSKSYRSTPVHLTAVRQDVWAHLPVDIYLNPCLTHSSVMVNCGTPLATVPLGDLVDSSGRMAAEFGFSTPATVTLPVSGWPNRFPSDAYELVINLPRVVLPSIASFSTGHGNYGGLIPTTITIAADPALADHTLTVVEDNSATMPLIIGLVIGRPALYQLTIYMVALLPLLLGGVVIHIWFRRRQPVFNLGFIAGLIAAMLTILPLRAVLIPADLSTVGLTLVDNILVLGILVIAAFLFAQYAMVVTHASNTASTQETSESSTKDRQRGSDDH